MQAYYLAIGISVLFLLAATAVYLHLALKYRFILEHQPTGKSLIDIFSHLPDPSTGPAVHVLGGACAVTGTSLLAATMVADILTPPDQFVANLVSVTGLFIGIAFSLITLWTLWQTRRIDYQAGYRIHDFYDLIHQLNLEVARLIESFNEVYGGRAQPFHRVYLVTTQPFLGSLSYPNKKATLRFRQNLRTLVDIRYESLRSKREGKNPGAFEFHVLCGDRQAIREFHKEFCKHDPAALRKAQESADEVNNDLCALDARFGTIDDPGPFYRVRRVPPVQFMIVGNKLFEFTLEAQKSRSEIFNTQVVHDTRFCKNYIETFDVLRDVYKPAGMGVDE